MFQGHRCVLIVQCAVLGLFSTSCMMDVSKLAGFSNPKLQMSVDASRGKFDMEAGTDFQGRAKGHYDPETKEIEAEIEVGSTASPVVKAEGERAESLVDLRQIEADMLVKMHEIAGDNIKAAGGIVKDVAKAAVSINRDNEVGDMGWIASTLWTLVEAALAVLVLLGLWGAIRLVWSFVRSKRGV